MPADERSLLVACVLDCSQKLGKARASLKIAQARRVRRRDVDGQVGRQRREPLNTETIIIDAIVTVLVGTDIDADNTALAGTRLQAGKRGSVALIVETEAVDDRLIFFQTEDAGFWVSGLRARGQGAHLRKSEPEPQERVSDLSVLVV